MKKNLLMAVLVIVAFGGIAEIQAACGCNEPVPAVCPAKKRCPRVSKCQRCKPRCAESAESAAAYDDEDMNEDFDGILQGVADTTSGVAQGSADIVGGAAQGTAETVGGVTGSSTAQERRQRRQVRRDDSRARRQERRDDRPYGQRKEARRASSPSYYQD